MPHPLISAADKGLLIQAILRPRRWVLHVIWILFCVLVSRTAETTALVLILVGAAVHYLTAQKEAKERRFIHPHFRQLWEGCKERFQAFEVGLKKLSKTEIVNLDELPGRVQDLAEELYEALRKADLLYDEIIASEQPRTTPAVSEVGTADRQAQELFSIAQRNVNEYQANYQLLIGGIHRTEAQASVFITTLDNIRVKLLGFRLLGKDPSIQSMEFLTALAEAKTQLDAIDRALDELDLSHYPQTIAFVPPPSFEHQPPPIPAHAMATAEPDLEKITQKIGDDL